jgi:hypothetical protein
MSHSFYQILHLFSIILLAGVTFAALAAPKPENRRFSLMWSGILSVVAFVTGFGLLGLGGFGFRGWVIVKIACWLALAALTGLAYRRPDQKMVLTAITVMAILLAVSMVIVKPF